jgi:protein TonB
MPASKPQPVAVPEPQVDETPEATVSPPKVEEQEAVIDTKPEEKKPEPKPEKKPQPKPQETTQPAESQEPAEGSAEGGGQTGEDVDAPVGSGSPFAGATIDNASFNYPYWFTQAFNKIASNWRNRIQYSRPLVCEVYFQVIKSGRVIELRIEESSGIPEFDEGCIQAVERAAPFPPLPPSFVEEIIGITLPFKYDPR